METRKELYERHKNKIDELTARMKRLHETLNAMEQIEPKYAAAVEPPHGELSSSEMLERKIERITASRKEYLNSLMNDENYLNYHQQLERGNRIWETSIKKMENAVESQLRAIHDDFRKKLESATTIGEERKLIQLHKPLLSPAEMDAIVSEVHGQLIRKSLNEFATTEAKKRGELTNYWIKRFGHEQAKTIVKHALTLTEKEKTGLPDYLSNTLGGVEGEPSFMAETNGHKPLAGRIFDWMNVADDSFMGDMLGKNNEEAHEVLDALDAMKSHPKGVKDFTKRISEKEWKDVLYVARTINRLKSEPAKLKEFLDEAENANFEKTLEMAKGIKPTSHIT